MWDNPDALNRITRLILAATRLQDADLAELNQQRPLVLINREVPGVASIHGPVEPGFDEAVAHLHLLGHRRIVYLSGPKDAWMSRQRTEILQEVGARRGVEIEVVGPNEPTLENGMRALTTLVAHDATAAITYNDMMAIGLLQAARKQGLEVPRDLSIIGFDDIFGSDFTCPPLTTIRVSFFIVCNSGSPGITYRCGRRPSVAHEPFPCGLRRRNWQKE